MCVCLCLCSVALLGSANKKEQAAAVQFTRLERVGGLFKLIPHDPACALNQPVALSWAVISPFLLPVVFNKHKSFLFTG